MGNHLEISRKLYMQNRFIQHPYLCVPTVLSLITEDFYNEFIEPFEMLNKFILKDENNSFKVPNKEIQDLFKNNFDRKFSIDESNNGLIISHSLTKTLLTLRFSIAYKFEFDNSHSKNLNKFLIENYFNYGNGAIYDYNTLEKLDFLGIVNHYKEKDEDFYIIGFIDFSIIKGKETDKNSNHCIIINKILDEKNIEVLIPHEDSLFESRIIPIELFEKSMKEKIMGFSIITTHKFA